MYPHERSLVERLKDKPFALIGVNSDPDLETLRKVVVEKELTWRSFWNGPEGTDGPISKKWGVRTWPTVYILDHKGVIRFKPAHDASGKSIDEAVDQLLSEIGQGG